MKIKNLGYSLAELSISMAIIAIITSGTLFYFSNKTHSHYREDTIAKLEIINKSIQEYIIKNGVSPVPEQINNLNLNINNQLGILPIKKLNLTKDYLKDGWGNYFIYRISKDKEFTLVNLKGQIYNNLIKRNFIVISYGMNNPLHKTENKKIKKQSLPEITNLSHDKDLTYISDTKTPDFDDIILP